MEVTGGGYKINFRGVHRGGRLYAIGCGMRARWRIIAISAEVRRQHESGKHRLCAVLQQTAMPVPKTY